MSSYRVKTPLTDEVIAKLKAGDEVLLTGTIYTARDAAHKRLVELLEQQKELPIDLKNQILYYVGPCPAKPGQIMNSAGPTTAARMDPFAPIMYAYGVKASIGKGPRSQEVKSACIEHKSIYFHGMGGGSVLLAKAVKEVEVVAYEDLGTEAIRRLEVQDFPLIVAYDIYGGDAYLEGIAQYEEL